MEFLRKVLSFFMSVIAMFTGFLSPAEFTPDADDTADAFKLPEYEGEALALVENGASSYVIVCAKQEGDPEYTAAQKLQKYLAEISGVTLPLVDDTRDHGEFEIIVGKTSREDSVIRIDRSGFGDETVNYFVSGSRLVIAGGEKRGTLYSVFEFLKNVLNCHWFTGELTVIPKGETVTVPAGLEYTYTPVLRYRHTDWISSDDAEYCLANHLNGKTGILGPENGGSVGYTGGYGHTLTNRFVNADKYFDEHPEYFARYLGVRTRKQLCLSNPDVLALVIEEVGEILEQEPDAQIISLTQGDTVASYCQCKDCLAFDTKNGSHAGTMINFVNQVAAAFEEKYPELMFDTFAYRYTRTAPSKVRPRKNVIVRLCSIECCFSHPLSDKTDLLNMWFGNDLRKWSEITDNLFIWDYTTNYWNYLGPFPDFGVLQDNMQFFVENNVKGIYEEGNYSAADSNAEFAELRCYLLSRLMFDPYCDYDAEADSFMRAYYGRAWQYVKEYIRMTVEHTGTCGRHMIIYHDMIDGCVLDFGDREIKYCDELWARAEKACEDETTLEHVQRSELSWRYWKACNMRSEFSRVTNPSGWKAENKKLYEDYRRFDITRFSEIKALSDDPNFLLTPFSWGEKR